MLRFYQRRSNHATPRHATPKLDEKQFYQLHVATVSLRLDIVMKMLLLAVSNNSNLFRVYQEKWSYKKRLICILAKCLSNSISQRFNSGHLDIQDLV
jgi:hypothetical protein